MSWVDPERCGKDAEEVVNTLNARADSELIGIGTRALRLYRLR
jgi:hypothetical protein